MPRPVVIGQDDVGAIADQQPPLVIEAQFLEHLHLFRQRGGIDHHTVADDAFFIGAENAGGNQVQDVLVAVEDDGMPGVVPALVTRHHVGLFGEQIDDLALPFISPLHSDDDKNRHGFPSVGFD